MIGEMSCHQLRTLPVAPDFTQGQSLDSYLERLAHSYDVSVRTILQYSDIRDDYVSDRRVGFSDDAIDRLSRITGIAALTLRQASRPTAHVDDPQLVVHRRPAHTPPRTTPSRYCPECLTDEPLVWMRAWHAPWTVACAIHHALMLDTCPRCGGLPWSGESRGRDPHVPPWQCQHHSNRRDGRKQRCGFDLRNAERATLRHGHPTCVAQAWIDELLRSLDDGLTFELLGIELPATDAATALAHLNMRAIRDQHDLSDAIAHNLGLPTRIQADPRIVARCAIRDSTLQLASRLTAAVDCLCASTLGRGAATLARYDELAVAGIGVRDTSGSHPHNWRESELAAWRTIQVAHRTRRQRAVIVDAMEIVGERDQLSVGEQIAYRAHAWFPRYPSVGAQSSASVDSTRRLPQMLWPSVVDQLPTAADTDPRTLRLLASLLCAQSGSARSWGSIALSLRLPQFRSTAVSFALHAIVSAGLLGSWLRALDAVHDLVAAPTLVPIDYARRRAVFDDLSDAGEGWKGACRADGIPPTPVSHALMVDRLYEMVTGSDPSLRRAERGGPRRRSDTGRRLTIATGPALGAHLREQAEHLLSVHGIDEPIQWEPAESDLAKAIAVTPIAASPADQPADRHVPQMISADDLTAGIATTSALDTLLEDILAIHHDGVLRNGPQLNLAVDGLYDVADGAWVLGEVGKAVAAFLHHTLGAELELTHWDDQRDHVLDTTTVPDDSASPAKAPIRGIAQ